MRAETNKITTYLALAALLLAGSITGAADKGVSTPPPDNLIVANSPSCGGIWTLEPNGSELTNLTPFGCGAELSKRGDQIAFAGNEEDGGIWVMNSDGGMLRQLSAVGHDPSWSTDDGQIVYTVGTGTTSMLWIMNADGTNPHLLSNEPGNLANWSHQTNEIVFEHYNAQMRWWEMAIIQPDGSAMQVLPYEGRYPSFSWDDSKILYSRGIPEWDKSAQCIDWELRTVPVSGGTPTKLGICTKIGSMGPNGKIVYQIGSSLRVDDGAGNQTIIAYNLEKPHWGVVQPQTNFEATLTGIGNIPYTCISSTGYATTASGYMIHVTDAPFGGVLNFFSAFPYLRENDIYSYQVLMAQWNGLLPPGPGDFQELSVSWNAYLWDSTQGKYMLKVVAPDLDNVYGVPAEGEFWYPDNLAMRYDTRVLEDGTYTFKLVPVEGNGKVEPNEIVVRVDNTPATAVINDISYNGVTYGECGIINLVENPDTIDFMITATDEHPYAYSFYAIWGSNHVVHLQSEYYPANEDPNGWEGYPLNVTATWTTCSYAFKLSVWDRTTNGYHRIHRSDWYETVYINAGTERAAK